MEAVCIIVFLALLLWGAVRWRDSERASEDASSGSDSGWLGMPYRPPVPRKEKRSWCSPERWNDYYNHFGDDDWRVSRPSECRFASEEIERCFQGRRISILDAGCGLSLIPEVLRYWGHDVTAVDLSSSAIDLNRARDVTAKEMAECIQILIPIEDSLYTFPCFHLDKDPAKKIELLESKKRSGGRLEWIAGDYRTDTVCSGPYDFILNLNGIKGASNKEAKSILQALYERVKPGGLVVESNINAIARQEYIEGLAKAIGFQLIPCIWLGAEIEPLDIQTECKKSIVCYWPTG